MIDLYRATIAQTFSDRCTVSVREKYTKENGSTDFRDNVVYAELPCRLSYSGAPPAERGETVTTVTKGIVLFTAPDADIPAGSKISVFHDGVTERFKQSGDAKVYATHREVALIREEERA